MARGLEAWDGHLRQHANVRTVSDLRRLTSADLRRMATAANMRLPAETIGQVLTAIRRPASRELASRPRRNSGEDETTSGYMTRVGLDAWRPHFSRHLPENMSSIEAVRATTAADLRRLGSLANMRLDRATIDQVLRALKKEPLEKKRSSKPKSKSSKNSCSRGCGFKGTTTEVAAHEKQCKFLSKEDMKMRRTFCTMLNDYSVCRELHASIDLPSKDWWDEKVKPSEGGSDPAAVKEFMKRRGLEAWYDYMAEHLNIRTIAEVKVVTAVDLRRMATRAHMRLDQKTIDQVLAALKRKIASEKKHVDEKASAATSAIAYEAFGPGWTLEMDAALVTYGIERARVKAKRSAGQLNPEDLFDPPDTESGTDGTSDEDSQPDPSEPKPDLAALRRGTSKVPQYTVQDVLSTPRRAQDNPGHLDDMSQDAIQARWKLLTEYNSLVEPALPMVDLRQFTQEGTLAHTLCVCKGRMFPDTKERLIQLGLSLTDSNTSVPHVSLTFPIPGSKEQEEKDSVFEQLFKQLHGKASLRTTMGEGRLWKTDLEGTATRAMWMDGTDAGGMFRSSVATLCYDLRQPLQRAADVWNDLDVELALSLGPVSCRVDVCVSRPRRPRPAPLRGARRGVARRVGIDSRRDSVA